MDSVWFAKEHWKVKNDVEKKDNVNYSRRGIVIWNF